MYISCMILNLEIKTSYIYLNTGKFFIDSFMLSILFLKELASFLVGTLKFFWTHKVGVYIGN